MHANRVQNWAREVKASLKSKMGKKYLHLWIHVAQKRIAFSQKEKKKKQTVEKIAIA